MVTKEFRFFILEVQSASHNCQLEKFELYITSGDLTGLCDFAEHLINEIVNMRRATDEVNI